MWKETSCVCPELLETYFLKRFNDATVLPSFGAFVPFHSEFSKHNEIKMMDIKWKISGLDSITSSSAYFFFILVKIHLAASGSRTNDYNFVLNEGGDKYCNYIKYKSNHLIKKRKKICYNY